MQGFLAAPLVALAALGSPAAAATQAGPDRGSFARLGGQGTTFVIDAGQPSTATPTPQGGHDQFVLPGFPGRPAPGDLWNSGGGFGDFRGCDHVFRPPFTAGLDAAPRAVGRPARPDDAERIREKLAGLSAEMHRTFESAAGTRIEPFGRVGAEGMLDIPDEDRVLDDSMVPGGIEPVAGLLMGGVGIAWANGTRFDARVGWGDLEDGMSEVGGEIGLSIPFRGP